MVDTDILEVYVEADSLVEVHRCEDAICVRRFTSTSESAPNFFPLKLSTRRRVVNWLVPLVFALGFLWAVWMYFS